MKGEKKMTVEEKNEILEHENELYRNLLSEERERNKPTRFECFTLGFTVAMLIAQIAIFVVQLILK